MRATDVIAKKRDGKALALDEIRFLVSGYVRDEIPEYQVSAWLMAVYLNGMSFEETGHLTRVMIESGAVFDLSSLPGPKVDKHSTGGVGDKTSLIIAPVVAACGVSVPMMSGRSLGHTGGTLDKLDTIPGYRTQLDQQSFVDTIKSCGFAMTGQTNDIVPADRRMYALRDVTSTVESIPLITASILSKKFAEGAEGFVFDVKTGSGAFMKSPELSLKLADSLVRTAASLDRKALGFITDMSFPLGTMVGNFLEVEECYRCLVPGSGLWDVKEGANGFEFYGPSAEMMQLSVELSAAMLIMAGQSLNRKSAFDRCLEALSSGKALAAFEKNVKLQGGDLSQLTARIGKLRAPEKHTVFAVKPGYLKTLNALTIGKAGVLLGVGRNKTDDAVLPDVGFEIHQKHGAALKKGDPICTIYAQSGKVLTEVIPSVEGAIEISDLAPTPIRLVQQVVSQA